MILVQIEFANNDFVNRSKWKTPFKIVIAMYPRGILDLRDVADEEKISVEGEEFSKHMNSLHKEMKLKLEKSNHMYKENIDKFRRHCVFEVGGEFMFHLKRGRFPIGTYSKFKWQILVLE